MNKKQLYRTTQFGFLIEANLPLLGETLDGFEGNSVISTFAPKLRPDKPWRSQIMENWVITSAYYWKQYQLRCILDREGKVNIYGPGGKPDYTYQIPEAGVFGESAAGYGYVNRIRAIGEHLYVCGMARQVYRFEFDGKTLQSGKWSDFAGALRQKAISEPPENSDDEAAFDQWMESNDAIDLVDIYGTSERDIYAVGDEAWHWNGQRWHQMKLPTDEPLTAIKIVSGDEVYLVGRNGTLLKGSAERGFVDLSGVHDNQRFTGVEMLNGVLYLASSVGLFTYNAIEKKILPCRTQLNPELQDAHVLEAMDGVLWSIGYKDLAWFDGKTWTRVDHPDNPAIR